MAGAKSVRRKITHWIPAFAGITGALLLAACAPETDTKSATPEPIAQIESEGPTLPNVPASVPQTPTLPESNLEDVDFTAYSTDLARFVGLEIGESRLASTDKIRLYFAPEPGTRMIKTASQTFERDDGSVLLFSRTGIPDDSVKAEEIYAIFAGPGGDAKFSQELAAYGMRIKCQRGENTTEWQTDLCP